MATTEKREGRGRTFDTAVKPNRLIVNLDNLWIKNCEESPLRLCAFAGDKNEHEKQRRTNKKYYQPTRNDIKVKERSNNA